MVRVAVVGEGHLAEATAAGCAKHLTLSEIPLADLVWFCVDTPVAADDTPDVGYIEDSLAGTLPLVRPGVPVLISSQIPVGTTKSFAERWPDHWIFCQPENIRKATAVEDFLCQDRIVVGSNRGRHELVESVLIHFTDHIVWMSHESAEMCKHVLNTWLGMNIAFANEMADISDLVGADVDDVFIGFRLDRRVSGPNLPGEPYRGGTLGRDVHVLAHHPKIWQRFPDFAVLRGVEISNGRRL